MMKKFFTRFLAALALLVCMTPSLAGWGQTRQTKTEGFELATAGTDYQSTVTVEAEDSDCGIGWEIYYGCVSTSSKINGNNSAALRLYTTENYGYIQTTTAIDGLSQVKMTAKAATTNSAHILINVKYSANGTNWTAIETDMELSASPEEYTFAIPSGGKYFQVAISENSVKPSKKNAQLTIDDVEFTYSTDYTVTFDCDGGDGCPDDVTGIEAGENNFTVPGDTPTKDCYTFDNVYLDNDLHEYVPGVTYTITGDLTLTASWTQNKYNITYKPNGATGNNVVIENQNCGSSYTIAGKPNAWTAPVETPYFVNWNTQDDGQGTTYTVGQVITISDDLELYAQWSATASYTVTYDCNGVESGCPDNATVLDGTQITLPAAPTYAGHTFNGWVCDADLQTYAAGVNYTVTSDVEFEAQWLENLSNPTFNVTGVSNGTDNTYYVTATIEIEQEDGAYIYYTTDGTDPTDASNEYTAAFEVTNSCTIKAIAIFDDYGNSQIASQEIIIVQPNVAEFTNGVYESLDTQNDYNEWYKYSVSGDQVWSWSSYQSTYYAKMSGYSGGNKANEDWLISPKMTVINGKLAVSFDCAAEYGSNALCSAQYSTNYPGYGDPSDYTWTQIKTLPYDNNFTFTAQNMTITGIASDVYFAIKYVSTTSEASTIEINNFSAKQCYPITYYANGGDGTTADANSPYAVGTEVTILENAFTAPTGKEFTSWNTQSDGLGTTKNPGNKITMTTDGYELYAIWGDACVLAATMNATTGEAVYDYNSGEKRFNITPSSSVKTLGGCDIYDYGFVYSTTVATPEIDADNCTKVQVGETQPEVGVAFNTTLNGLTLGETYHVRSYATNAAGTAYSEVIDVEVPANFDNYRYEISYTTNGTAEASTYVYQGAPISGLATPTEANVPEGFTFMGWYGGDYGLSNTAPTYVKNGDAINSNLALEAVFAICSNGGEGTVELTNTTIKNNRTGKTSYGNYTIDDWSGKFMIAKNGEVYGLQLGYNASSTASAYNSHLTTPECPYNITSITIVTNNNTASGRTFYLCNADNLGTASSGTYGSGSTSSANGSVTINVSGNTKQFHIYPNGTAYIESITLAYSNVSYSSYCTSVRHVSDMAIEGYGDNEGGYYLIASPVATTPVVAGMITDNYTGNDNSQRTYDLYYFDQSEENEWQNYRAQTFILEPGKGYLYASKEDLVEENRLSFTGAPYSGDGIINLDYDENAEFAGWNLIGNPYTTAATLDKAYYRLNGAGDALNASTESTDVAAMEGVFVQTAEAGQSATFTQTSKGGKKSIAKVELMLNGNKGIIDNAIIRFDEGETLEKFMLRADGTKLYFTENHKDYAIVRSNNQGELPVNFKASKNGTYTLSVKPENVEVSYLHLIDNLTGANVDLLANPSYTFEASTTDYASRFRLVFKANTDVEENTATETFAYFNGSEWVINGTGDATLQVIDMMGRVLRSEQINGNTAINLNQAAGIYMLRLVNGENVMVQKVVVR